MVPWLIRLSFSMYALTFVLAWEGRRILRSGDTSIPQWKIAACFVGAAACFVVGTIGTYYRHRPRD